MGRQTRSFSGLGNLSFFILLVSVLSLNTISCGGGGSSSLATDGLDIASQVSLVDANSSSSNLMAALVNGDPLFAVAGDFPAGSAINNVVQDIWVYDPSIEALSMVNEILCSIAQSGYDQIPNGTWKAQINVSQCSKDSVDTGSSENTTSGNSVEWEYWTLQSTRNEGEAQHVKVWIPETSKGDLESTITVSATITEAASTSNPYGVFRLDFEMETTYGTGGGYLESTYDSEQNASHINIFLSEENGMFEISGAIVRDYDEDGTVALTSITEMDFEGGPGPEADTTISIYKHAYNDNFGLVQEEGSSEQRCLDRTSYTDHVINYRAFNSSGVKQTLSSGMPFNFTNSEGEKKFGYLGYYGIHFHGGTEGLQQALATTIQNEFTSNTYTLKAGPFKLIKQERVEATLGDIDMAPMQWFDNESGEEYRIRWNGEEGQFEQICQLTFGGNGPPTCEEEFDPSVAMTIEEGSFLGAWMEGFGSIILENAPATLSNSTTIYTIERTVLNSASPELASGSIILYMYQDVPDVDFTNTAWPFLTNIEDINSPAILVVTVADSGFSLTVNAETFSAPSLLAGQFKWGAMSGPGVTDLTGITSPWELWGQDTTYHIEFGHNAWNYLVEAYDSTGTLLTFDAPLKCEYTATLEDGTSKPLFLEWTGDFLGGIPMECDDTDGNNGRCYPEFNVPDYSELTCTNGEGTESTLYLRQKDIERRLDEVDLSNCSDLNVDNLGLTLPSATDVQDVDIGTMPSDAELQVVAGELVE